MDGSKVLTVFSLRRYYASDAYFRVEKLLHELANPNLHDIPTNLPFRFEMWDRTDQHTRWVVAACSSGGSGRDQGTAQRLREGLPADTRSVGIFVNIRAGRAFTPG